MMAASAQVIGHRARRTNGPAQLFEMGNEKVQAAMESSRAMTRQWLAMQGDLGSWSRWIALASSGLAPFHARALKNARRARRR